MEITAHICPRGLPGINTISGVESVSVSSGLITAKIKKNTDTSSAENAVEAKICPSDKNPWDYFSPYGVWGFPVSIRLNLQKSNSYIIKIFHPTNKAMWKSTQLLAIGFPSPEKPRVIGTKQLVTSGGYAIPQSFEDVMSPKGFFEIEFESVSMLCPGEKAAVQYEYNDGLGIHTLKNFQNGFAYWSTPFISGGYVTDVIGNYGETGLLFMVEIEGDPTPCLPSDFVKYEVGDFVFVLKDIGVIIPLNFSGIGYGQ